MAVRARDAAVLVGAQTHRPGCGLGKACQQGVSENARSRRMGMARGFPLMRRDSTMRQ